MSLGEGRLMFSSRASLTAAIMEAEMTRVEAKRSVMRCSSSFAMALFMTPMDASIGE